MFIKATEKANTPSHSLKKGDVVNMRSADAEKLIKSKKAVKATDAEAKKAQTELDKKSK